MNERQPQVDADGPQRQRRMRPGLIALIAIALILCPFTLRLQRMEVARVTSGMYPINVVGLHKLPFDEAAFAKDLSTYGDHASEWEPQLRQNWSNAWLIVIEFRGAPGDLNFDAFATLDGQAAWLEQTFEQRDGITRAAFYMHYVDPTKPLRCGKSTLDLPAPSRAPAALLRRMPYSSPD
jgi:hypothetical protein